MVANNKVNELLIILVLPYSEIPEMMGIYKPTCNKDGTYVSMQTHESLQWCTNPDGTPIRGTLRRYDLNIDCDTKGDMLKDQMFLLKIHIITSGYEGLRCSFSYYFQQGRTFTLVTEYCKYHVKLVCISMSMSRITYVILKGHATEIFYLHVNW